MRKASLILLALMTVLALGAGNVYAADHSIGYQGMLGTGTNVISGLSYRGWADALGWEATLFHASVDMDNAGDASMLGLEGQCMFALVQKEYSKMYVGGSLGIGKWSMEANSGGDADDTFWWLGPVLGAQYSFQELPELTFNWEVAYNYGAFGTDQADSDITLTGFNTTMGIHYAF